VRLYEKGGKPHEVPCHQKLEEYLHTYLNKAAGQRTRRRTCFGPSPGRTDSLPKRMPIYSDLIK
jgi:hypothetical protein